ncbi:hypothetical protein CTM62_11780 [Prevotella intermedia]|uniref:Uncharacterized protein n=1 Tax=Prevotella intermedia TaxID=28131 RepID=A0A2D3LA50_PREIN|nr:hypothetical protein CTM62_11780 [Prevotella intermedia]
MHGKSGCFASQNLRFRNAKAQLSLFKRIIFTKALCLSVICQQLFGQKKTTGFSVRRFYFLLGIS